MVTSNGARFKDRNTIMNDQHQSYVDRYIRAKKRTEVTPKCLFGAPRRTETDRFLLRHELEQMTETRAVYEKYDLSEIADGDEKDNLFPEFECVEAKADESAIFQPKVVTELDSPPSGSLFSPIEKFESSGAVGSGETKLTDYWQTSKRRRSSSNLESNSEHTEEGDDSDCANHQEKEVE